MLDFLKTILDFLVMVKDLIVNVITGLFSVLTLIPQGLQFVTGSIGYMPSVLATFAITGITICIIFFVIDR